MVCMLMIILLEIIELIFLNLTLKLACAYEIHERLDQRFLVLQKLLQVYQMYTYVLPGVIYPCNCTCVLYWGLVCATQM